MASGHQIGITEQGGQRNKPTCPKRVLATLVWDGLINGLLSRKSQQGDSSIFVSTHSC